MHKIVLQKPCAHCGKMHYTNVPGALVVNEEYYCQLSCAEAEHPQLNKEIQPQLPFFEGAD